MSSLLFRTASVVALVLISLSLHAADTKPDPEFVELFNGKDLSGWGYKAGDKFESFDDKAESSDGRYSVKDGILVVNPGKGIKQLWTMAKFPKDFELRLEFRAAVNADSGLFIRRPQLQVRDYLVAGPYKELKKYKAQDWNEIVVVVKGTTARCTCNGEVLEEALKVPETGGIGLEADGADGVSQNPSQGDQVSAKMGEGGTTEIRCRTLTRAGLCREYDGKPGNGGHNSAIRVKDGICKSSACPDLRLLPRFSRLLGVQEVVGSNPAGPTTATPVMNRGCVFNRLVELGCHPSSHFISPLSLEVVDEPAIATTRRMPWRVRFGRTPSSARAFFLHRQVCSLTLVEGRGKSARRETTCGSGSSV